ncbi:unnamed protein product [Closterium sp. NIES-54]
MAADVQQFVTSCDTCQQMKSSKQKKTGLLQPLPVPEQPWQVVSLDFITGLPSTSRGHDSILVVIDKFSKMGHFIPTNATATAEATARLLFDRIITIPATLISDRDPKFTSKFWKELMGLLGTKLAMSSAYHPQTDGQTERLNQVVEQLLRTACKDDVSHWDTQLPTLEFAYNNASHAATWKTPFFLCYGQEPLTPQQPTTPAHVQAAHDFVTTMQQLWEKNQRRLTTMQTSQKQYAGRHYIPLALTRYMEASQCFPCSATEALQGPQPTVQPTPLTVDHGLMAPPSDEPFESSGPYPELVGCLICEAEVYAAAMAAQELRWLSFLLTDLVTWVADIGARPLRRPPTSPLRGACSRRCLHPLRLNAADFTSVYHSSLPRQRASCSAAELVTTSVDTHVDAAFAVHRSRRGRSSRVLLRPQRADACLDDHQRKVWPVLVGLMASHRVLQPCL